MCLKTENCCLKSFVEIRVGEKVCGNTWNVVWKLKMVVWKHKPNTPLTLVFNVSAHFLCLSHQNSMTPLSHLNRVSPLLSLALHSLNLDCASTSLSTSTLAPCLSLNPVVSCIPNSNLEAKTKKKQYIVTHQLRSRPHTLAPFLDLDQRESKGWGLERIRCLSENLILFRPVRIWIETG